MVWNGSAWVTPAASNIAIPDNPVQTYTKYYHEWTAKEKALQAEITNLHSSGLSFPDQQSRRQALSSEKQWAKYYADESSRAAHHFYQHPNQPPPFSLPKAPPSLERQIPPPPPPPPPPPQPNNAGATPVEPGSLTRYLKRNLENCKTQAEKKHVQADMEKRIASAIQAGVLQSKNWDVEPLILPQQHHANTGNYAQPQLQPAQPAALYHGTQNRNSNNQGGGGYYGPAATSGPSSYSAAASRAANHGSYYGPSSGAATTLNSHNNHSQNDAAAYSYYGNPSNNSSSLSPSSHSPQNNSKRKTKKKRQLDGNEDYLALPSIKHKKQRQNQLIRRSDSDGMDASEEALQKRANRFADTGYVDDSVHNSYTTAAKYMGMGTIGGSGVELTENDFEQMTVKGTCQTLEKQYLRLTAPPRPERVRPLAVLQQHLQNLKNEYYKLNDDDDKGNDHNALLKQRETTPQDNWKYDDDDDRNGNVKDSLQLSCRRHDYLWFCSQLKAVRQDCTVQRIQGDFAVDVYETHARIALQEGDLNEYNQCQTQLKELYQNVPSAPTDDDGKETANPDDSNATTKAESEDAVKTSRSCPSWENEEEFIAYRLLYYVYLSTNEKYSGGSSDMFHIMLSLTSKQKQHPAIAHALQVREAVACSDYYRFFRTLTTRPPNLGMFLTNLLVPTMRMRGLRRIAKAYRPSVELNVCLQYLGLIEDCGDVESEVGDETVGASNESDALKEGTEFLISCGAIVKDGKVLTKDSEVHEPVTDKKNSLI
ncbi:MAG: hypothetical protein SGILL_005655 [Bacillariaceae sp.]